MRKGDLPTGELPRGSCGGIVQGILSRGNCPFSISRLYIVYRILTDMASLFYMIACLFCNCALFAIHFKLYWQVSVDNKNAMIQQLYNNMSYFKFNAS